MSKLIINCNTSLSFLSLTQPRILIDGVKQPKGSWRYPNSYELKPGFYQLMVYLPSPLFLIPTCTAKVNIEVKEGDSITFSYKLPLFTFLPGKLILENHFKGNIAQESPLDKKNRKDKMIPENCPHCKNPNTMKVSTCEWCGNQIV